MSTIYAFDEELAAVTTVADGDIMLLHQASSGLKKKITAKSMLTSYGGVVDTTATTLTITQALHSGRIVTISSAAPIAITLPAVTGTGNIYRFVVEVAATGTAHTINRATTADVMQGVSWCLTTSSANVIGYGTTATDNTISLNGTTKGGVVGDIIELTDVKSGVWSVKVFASPTGSTATPFSHV